MVPIGDMARLQLRVHRGFHFLWTSYSRLPTFLRVLVCVLVFVMLWRWWYDSTFPPLYLDIARREWMLPQHNMSLPFPEGKEGER